MFRRQKKKQTTRTKVTMLVVAITAVTSVMMARVWTNVSLIQHGYAISDATHRHHTLVQTNQTLRAELATLKSPSRITQVAEADLGLTAADPTQVRRLRVTPVPEIRDEHLLATRNKARPKMAGW